ncbi:Elongator complex protein 5 [Dichotomopilus funicola]|uniref:Elongator complex protein 5 n=1 Tax=Dichotomopilus funicola TaxID=1934379 RepID=A0AAN6ZLL8_9PEZI|nr:Elongator complex protein 5 [Dichotomopilus funicola]
MAPSAQAHKRAHSLLLFEKLLNLRESASPLTLILDTLEQSGQPLLYEFMRRAKLERTKTVFVSFATVKKPTIADIFIRARGLSLKSLAAEIVSHVGPPRPSSAKEATAAQKFLIIIDTLNPPTSTSPSHLPPFFTSIILPPTVSLVAIYHTDIPTLPPHPSLQPYAQYHPHPQIFLTHLATAVLRVLSVHHAIAARRARERSLVVPEWGLREGREGVLVGLCEGKDKIPTGGREELVVEMELRRRSGRAVGEVFVISTPAASLGAAVSRGELGTVMVMRDHPDFRRPEEEGETEEEEGGGMETSFNLGLTEKQRRDREAVVLPYFDAQVDVGGGEGGRILYDMGREDDFDEEEDEI